jgi:hypothetical protein
MIFGKGDFFYADVNDINHMINQNIINYPFQRTIPKSIYSSFTHKFSFYRWNN